MFLRTVILTIAIVISPDAWGATNIISALKESRVSGEFRTYFFQRDFDGVTRDRQDFAVGGKIRLETGELQGISAGLSVYTSQGLGLNSDNKAVYGLLAKDAQGHHKSYTALGELYLQAQYMKTTLKIGRQEMKTPWVNLHDIRMTPQSFEALQLSSEYFSHFKIVVAHVTKIKLRTATDFIYMSQAAKVSQKEPVTLGGVIYSGIEGMKLQLWDYYAWNMWNDVYLRLDYRNSFGEDFPIYGDIRYLYRRGIGDELAGPSDTYAFGIRGDMGAYGATFSLAWAKNGAEKILRPWGHNLEVAIQVNVADQADEEAWRAMLGYDFGRIGLKGLSGYVIYGDFNTPNTGANASPDANEFDFSLEYDISRFVKGLSLRARCAIIDEDDDFGGEDYTDVRFQLRYKFDFGF